jgi:hypothetical protein
LDYRLAVVCMQSWDGLRLGLLALGFSKVVWIHLHCVRLGFFWVGIAEEQNVIPCPTCEQACSASILCEGFTKQPLPFPPERIHAQLTSWERRVVLAEERIAKPRRVPDMLTGANYDGAYQSTKLHAMRVPGPNIMRSWAMPRCARRRPLSSPETRILPRRQ